MVSASIDNETVDIDLAEGNTVTVPSGETWLLKTVGAGKNGPLKLQDASNGQLIANPESTADRDILLTGGDTIAYQGKDGYDGYTDAIIRGFKL